MIKNFPNLEINNDIKLRELIIFDKEILDFFEIYQNEEVSKYLPDNFLINSLQDAERELKYLRNLFYKKDGIFWGIEDKKNQKLIGTIGFNQINNDHSRTQIGCDLNRNYWGGGIMTICLQKIIEFGFKEISLNRIECFIEEDNLRSIKLFEKIAFEKEGFLRKYEIRRRQYKNFFVYSKLRLA